MNTPINILIVEDSKDYADLLVHAMQQSGFEPKWKRVETEPDFLAGLKNSPDIILSDYSMPQFSGLRAAELAKESGLKIPFILISGTVGEDIAVEAMKQGATDFLLKDRIARLGSAVRRALQEAGARAERIRLEAQLIEAQKMEVIGHLASGVAHDFNNILGVIIGYSDLAIQQLEPGGTAHKCVVEIRHAANRATALTRQLLVFSRKQTVQPVVLDLNDVVSDLDKMLLRLIDENIELAFCPEKEIGRIMADSGHIGQVLMNLVVNARDAMPNGGKLAIATENVTLDENFARAHAGVVPGEYVMLSVSDTGSGMTGEVKRRMFDAFFTTKPAGKGTGLGLATCQTIVQQCCGHIVVDSELGKGTTFKIYFPRVGKAVDAPAKPVENGVMPRGTETLLLVEDEPSVRHLACSILEAQGYTVVRANNGQDALRLAHEHKGSPIRLVVTDVIMPLMSGRVMAEWLKTIHPDMKILFTSGYTDDAISKHGALEKGMAFLPKPYSPAALTRKVRAMLDNQSDSAFLRKEEALLPKAA